MSAGGDGRRRGSPPAAMAGMGGNVGMAADPRRRSRRSPALGRALDACPAAWLRTCQTRRAVNAGGCGLDVRSTQKGGTCQRCAFGFARSGAASTTGAARDGHKRVGKSVCTPLSSPLPLPSIHLIVSLSFSSHRLIRFVRQ